MQYSTALSDALLALACLGAAVWLGKARSALLSLTKERLAIILSVDPGETDSILRLVQSQLDVSLRQLMAD